ncbi:Putative phosphinothricin acetyltransferase YwnH [Lentilactobacillus hilgardii]|uniref:GNAT family N-acetyltransferase n=1 Tax=Lentilactobacillus hilgardii TaxID=1588 RepID=UPI00019C5459|nr:GNAT family N-acetyltransferase [Lentilactobacillus hilgardii]EEI20104.1 acetyltransferase, GNAT family [Lentilactobacillus buchneri ATCC 11577]MCT3396709.1 N-acetyltransferase [Lentilactobacillus hilgardii]QIR08859.1 Putative phosphinothricin acetyltransferase YwnH [Lentilactobacillus hilgardii]
MKLTFTYADITDLPKIVDIYNETIASRMVTADLEPVSIASKRSWFNAFNHEHRPIWKIILNDQIAGWVSLESFYGRPAYHHTVEISIYIDAEFRHHGLGQQALDFVATQLKDLEIDTIVSFIFAHNLPSLGLFKKNGFQSWGHLPEVAELDGQRRDLDILGRRYY